MPLDPELTEFTTQSPVIASFSFTDIADGTGVISFNGAKSVTSAGDGYILTTQSIFSNDIETASGTVASNNVFVKLLDLDFDAVLNTPRDLFGTAYINATSYGQFAAGAGGSHSSKMIFKIRKWDGSSETEIISVETETLTNAIGTGAITKEWLVNVTIPETHFNIGETIRVTAELWGRRSVNGSIRGALSHDPVARDTVTFPANDAYTTQLKFNIPFKLPI